MNAVYCPKCSTAAPENAQFCSVCGTFLSIHGEHPTLLMEPVDQDGVDTGATVLAERAEDVEHTGRSENVSISSMRTERHVPRGVMGLSGEHFVRNPTYATPGLHGNDDNPTMPGVLAQFDQATILSGTPSSQPGLSQREQPGAQLFLTQQSNLVPVQYPRPGAVDARRHNQKSFLVTSRYFIVGTGFLLLIGIIALAIYPSLLKGKMSAVPGTTAAYARLAPTSHPVVTLAPTVTPVVQSTPTATPDAQPQSMAYAGLMPTPMATSVPPPNCLHVNTPALNFSTTSRGNALAPQTITLGSTCTTGAWSVRWDASWLSASPVYNSTINGVTPVVINVSSANLAANSYSGHIIFSSGSSHATVTVTLIVAQPTFAVTSCVKVDQNSLSFSSTAQHNPAPQTIQVTNCGSAGTVAAIVSTSYTSQVPGQADQMQHNGTNWLTTSARGQLAGGDTLPIHVSVTALKAGVYTSSIAITITTSDGKTETRTVNVTFTVQGGQATPGA